jgi:phage/conjugal plasmid C-4 type zinc finger TraR family protein
MDEIDQAQGHNEDFQAYVLEQHRRAGASRPYTGTTCQDCEDEIPLKRRQAVPGCRRCIDCQTLLENWRPL